MKSSIITKILNDISLDPRIENGVFCLENNLHMDILREYLIKRGIDEKIVKEYTNLVLEGKYPERQAYNKDGILVTFPTSKHKQRAIERGTHFEDDPTKKEPNIFEPTSVEKQPESKDKTVQTNLPLSQVSSTEISSSIQTTTPPASIEPPKEPVVKPDELPSTPPPSSQEKEAYKDVIKKMLNNDKILESENNDVKEKLLNISKLINIELSDNDKLEERTKTFLRYVLDSINQIIKKY